MAIQIAGCTVIDNSRNIVNANNMCVGTGITMIGSTGNISIAGTITVGGLDFPPQPITFSPGIGATNIVTNTSISITFNQQIQKGTGNITLRNGSGIGTVIQTIGIASTTITVSGAVLSFKPPVDLPDLVNVYVVLDAGAVRNVNINSGNSLLNNYYFLTVPTPALGASYQGGRLICCQSPVRWVVAPSSSQVIRTWGSSGDAVTTAQQVSGCTGWFVPSCGQLQNPGYACRVYWDSYVSDYYWSSSQRNAYDAYRVNMADGSANGFGGGTSNQLNKTASHYVRAFRCVTY